MVIEKVKVYKSLRKKGFIESVNKSSDHLYLELFYEGKLILYTKISHGSDKEIGNYLIKQMSHQCKLNKKDFIDLVKCPLSKENYIQMLVERGFIEQ